MEETTKLTFEHVRILNQISPPCDPSEEWLRNQALSRDGKTPAREHVANACNEILCRAHMLQGGDGISFCRIVP